MKKNVVLTSIFIFMAIFTYANNDREERNPKCEEEIESVQDLEYEACVTVNDCNGKRQVICYKTCGYFSAAFAAVNMARARCGKAGSISVRRTGSTLCN